MKTRKPLRRGSPIQRKTRPKPVNRKRKAREFKRTYGSSARAEFVRAMVCIVARAQEYPKCRGDVVNAHVPSKSGAGRKGDARFCVPLCDWHHHQLDDGLGSKRLFNLAYGVDLDAEAAAVEEAWQAFNGSTQVEHLPHRSESK